MFCSLSLWPRSSSWSVSSVKTINSSEAKTGYNARKAAAKTKTRGARWNFCSAWDVWDDRPLLSSLKTLSLETERKRWAETDVSSNRPCSRSNNQKFPCCQPACLRLLVSHTASINQVSAQTWGSKRNCERHWGPTGQDADGKEAAMKEGSWVCGKRVKCGEVYSCPVEVMSIPLHVFYILPLPIFPLSTFLYFPFCSP